MKYCAHCGNSANDDQQFCPSCGNAFPAAAQQPQYAAPQYAAPQYAAPQAQLSMKWYNFLVKFALLFGVVCNLIGAILNFTGITTMYNYLSNLPSFEVSDFVEALFEGELEGFFKGGEELKTCGIVAGVLTLALCVLGVMAWSNLKSFSKKGITFLYATYAGAVAVNIVYNIFYISALKELVGDSLKVDYSGMIGTIAVYAVIIALNMIYFKKRAHMFH